METSDHGSINVENECTALATSVEEELETLGPISPERCIFRVPDRLRRLNERAFTPRVVSIGPLHHGKESLQVMEEHKRRCLQDFLHRSNISLATYIRVIKLKEERIRNFYAETIRLISDDFVRMVLVDAAFVIKLLSRIAHQERVDDHIQGTPAMIFDIRNDLCLLENQLPFFILEELYRLAYGHHRQLSMVDLSVEFVNSYFALDIHLDENFFSARHIVDLLTICLRPSSSSDRSSMKMLNISSATALHRAGVTFSSAASKNLFDVNFENGILKIPPLKVVDGTELLLRNVMAFEQCSCYEFNRIADYVTFMSYLMSTRKDAGLLVQNGIIDNLLRDAGALSTLFKDLTQEAFIDGANFYFAGIVEDLNAYCRTPWHNWCATLKQEYFKNPWATASVIAAVVLLILTFVQTVCSILQVT